MKKVVINFKKTKDGFMEKFGRKKAKWTKDVIILIIS